MCFRLFSDSLFYFCYQKIQVNSLVPVRAVLTSAYLPPLSYLSVIAAAHEVFIEVHETYPRQSYRNRCQILGPNGRQNLIIPVKRPEGNHTKIKDIWLVEQDRWRLNHWRSIEAAYRSAPFFTYYADELKHVLFGQNQLLIHLNHSLLRILLGHFSIYTPVSFTSHFEKIPDGIVDIRHTIHPKQPTILISQPEYTQVFADKENFETDLSAIDVLFNQGPASPDFLGQVAFAAG